MRRRYQGRSLSLLSHSGTCAGVIGDGASNPIKGLRVVIGSDLLLLVTNAPLRSLQTRFHTGR